MAAQTNNKANQIISNLKSDNINLIKETLANAGNDWDHKIIPDIIDLLMKTTDSEIEISCSGILNNIKIPLYPEIVMNKIQQYRNHQRLFMLVSSCWQTLLDFSPYMEQFVNIAIEEDYKTAVEAFTVIEVNIQNTIAKTREQLTSKIKEPLFKIEYEKRKLLMELAGITNPFAGPFSLDS